MHVAGPGTVLYAGEQQGYGKVVLVEHADGLMKREDRAGAEAALALEAFDGSVPEALSLAEALDLLGRGEEGLQLRSRLASEPGQEGNAELQRSLAAAARKLRREDVARQACARLAAATDGGTGEPCP